MSIDSSNTYRCILTLGTTIWQHWPHGQSRLAKYATQCLRAAWCSATTAALAAISRAPSSASRAVRFRDRIGRSAETHDPSGTSLVTGTPAGSFALLSNLTVFSLSSARPSACAVSPYGNRPSACASRSREPRSKEGEGQVPKFCEGQGHSRLRMLQLRLRIARRNRLRCVWRLHALQPEGGKALC